MINKIVGGILLGSLLVIPSANATPTMNNLFDAIGRTGVEFLFDTKDCKDNPTLMGSFRRGEDKKGRFELCVENHKGDNAWLYDTILHEAVHVAQNCNDNEPIYKRESKRMISHAQDLKWPILSYDSSEWGREAEAWVIAHEQDEVFVTQLVRDFCQV